MHRLLCKIPLQAVNICYYIDIRCKTPEVKITVITEEGNHMTPKQRWYCFWVIIVVTVLLTAGFVWFAIHNPQASWNTLFSNLWDSFVNFVSG